MKINIDKILPEGSHFEAKESAKALDIQAEGAEFSNPIEVSILALKSGNTLIIKGWLKTKVDFKCGRCLKDYSAIIENKNLDYSYNIEEVKELDISPDIREEMILLLPIRPLCKKDCKGFCQRCGQDLNEKKCTCKKGKEDIRWSELDRLKVDKKER
jgi:uncharacterized protein